ncbi:MAG: hypothetical protein GF330_07460 [Candidatus Eisenbacteria bacterium]|nr:hypothetical protein [Candidatus Eisenbacteria bacterium]
MNPIPCWPSGRGNRLRRLCALLVVLPLLSGGCGDESGQDAETQVAGADLAQQTRGRSPDDTAEEVLERIRSNKPPRARFEVLPPKGYAGMSRFRFDGSFASDDFNLAGEMFKRWDFDGDGEWDTPFSRATRVSHVYAEPGSYRPRLEVRDTAGATDSTRGSTVEVLESCPAPDFALVDENPNSATFGEIYRLSDYRGRRVVLWLASPSS